MTIRAPLVINDTNISVGVLKVNCIPFVETKQTFYTTEDKLDYKLCKHFFHLDL